MQGQYIALKPLTIGREVVPAGTVIDPTGWRTLDKLIDQGRVAFQTQNSAAEAKQPVNNKPATRSRKANGGS